MIIEAVEAERGLIWLSQVGASCSLRGSNGRLRALMARSSAISSAQPKGEAYSAVDVVPGARQTCLTLSLIIFKISISKDIIGSKNRGFQLILNR